MGKHKAHLSDAARKRVAKRYLNGETCRSLAIVFGVSHQTILNIVVAQGGCVRTRNQSRFDRVQPNTQAKWAAIAEQNAREAGYV